MKRLIQKELNLLGDNGVILMIFPKEEFHELNMHALKTVLKNSNSGAYVSINRSYDNLIKLMKEKRINPEKVFFIDCVSEKSKAENIKNCVFIGSAESLTNIALALNPIYKSKEHEFIFLDSFNALSNYHKPEMIVRFGRDLIKKVRENQMVGIMIGLSEDTDRKIIDEIAAVCDKIIDLSK